MSGTQRQAQLAIPNAPGRKRAAGSANGRRRRPRPTVADRDAPLRLLPARTRPMSGEQEQRLVVSLGELIVELIEADPDGLEGLRTGRGCDLDGCSRAKEQP
jgi:hypothetical protein